METTFATGQFQNVVLQHHLSAWRFFLLGDLDRALVSGEKALAGAIESGNITNIELCNHNMANIYDALGDHQRATAYLALALESNRKWQGLSLEFACLVTKAYFALRWGETAAGIEVLRKAMSLGRSQGYMGVFFWWDPRAMVYLCAIALDAGIEVEYVQTLIRKRNLVPDSSLVVPESWPWPVKIYTLGRFELNIDDKPVLFPGKVQQKPLALLKALIAFGGRDVSEEQLTDELWPDSEGDTGHVAFDTTLHRLRKLVGNEKALILRDGMLSLDDRYCWTDVGAFEKIIAECGLRNAEGRTKTGAAEITSAQSETALFEKAINLYKGHFLPGDTKQPWSISLRERLRARFHNSVSSLGRHWVDTGRYDNAVQVFLKGLEIDDLAEEFYQHLMACYHQMGQQTAAIKTYHRCCGVLQSSLGLKPSSKTEGVYYSIRQNG
jgi:DNA-binding SARP family transcriptional activator